VNFPIDGYVATKAWAQKYPDTAAAFVRAIEAGQLMAGTDPAAAQAAIAKYDNLGPLVTTSMALSGYPVGPVNEARIQRVAMAMLQFGLLGRQYAPRLSTTPWSNRWSGPSPEPAAGRPGPGRLLTRSAGGAHQEPADRVGHVRGWRGCRGCCSPCPAACSWTGWTGGG
jgi:hypothetical protein